MFISIILVGAPLLAVPIAHVAHAESPPNLFANSSVETEASSAAPVSWTSNAWGTNTAGFSYPATGRTGTRSVRVDITAYTDGDAKWFPNAVGVTAGSEYRFSDFYQSNVDTRVVVQYTTSAGTNTYEELAPAAASPSAWTEVSRTLTVPAGVTTATVFHLISSVGWLAIDDASLVLAVDPEPTPPPAPPIPPTPPTPTPTPPTPAPASPNLVPNSSVETVNPSIPTEPASWLTNKWGTNTAVFQHVDGDAKTGTRSVKVTLSGYANGDAKWYFSPINVTGSTQYNVSDQYKASVQSRVVAVTYDAANNPTYQEMAVLPLSMNDWQPFNASFTTPSNAVKGSIFHVIESNGFLQLDDMSLSTAAQSPPTTNLVMNPSVETAANSTTPQNWASNKWGTNTATFSYLSTGHTGTRSVHTNMTAFTNGDAKWYFNPVNVAAAKKYNYSHFYQASVPTSVVMQYTKADGSLAYETVATPAVSAGWSEVSFSFTTPANTTKVTIFHVIAAVGNLTVDDANLVLDAAAPSSNPIGNPSAEQAAVGNPNRPAQWATNEWGSNSASFQYITNDGHDGARSVRATISNYVSGDAKWLHDPVPVEPGSRYRFTGWYKTNTNPKAVVLFNMQDGSEFYVGLPNPLPPANAATVWQQYSDSFSVPQNAESATVFFMVDSNGYVQADDFKIEPYTPTGFTRPLVTLTFDDGHEENHSTALSILTSHGFKSTQCYATAFIEGVPDAPGYVMQFKNAGHEICSHSVTHPFLTQIPPTQLTHELQHSKQYLEGLIGESVPNFATPYGDYNAAVNTAIAANYQSHRTVDEGYNSKDNFNIYRLRVQNLLDVTSAAEFQGWLDQAEATNTWLILVYHRVTPSEPGPFDTLQSDFVQQMDLLDASDLTVKTWQAALNEILPQLP